MNPNVLIASTPFTFGGIMNFGARMSLFKHNDNIVVWSAFPYCEDAENSLKQLAGSDNYKVTHLIIPNNGHSMGVKSFMEKFPEAKVIAAEKFPAKDIKVDYVIPDKYKNKVIDQKMFEDIGLDETISKNFKMVYLGDTRSCELVLYENKTKLIFVGDLTLNFLSYNKPLEQYSKETGWPENKSPIGGLAYFSRYLNPDTAIWRFLSKTLYNTTEKTNQDAIRTIYNMDFNTLVPCHGNISEGTGKEELRAAYKFLQE